MGCSTSCQIRTTYREFWLGSGVVTHAQCFAQVPVASIVLTQKENRDVACFSLNMTKNFVTIVPNHRNPMITEINRNPDYYTRLCDFHAYCCVSQPKLFHHSNLIKFHEEPIPIAASSILAANRCAEDANPLKFLLSFRYFFFYKIWYS